MDGGTIALFAAGVLLEAVGFLLASRGRRFLATTLLLAGNSVLVAALWRCVVDWKVGFRPYFQTLGEVLGLAYLCISLGCYAIAWLLRATGRWRLASAFAWIATAGLLFPASLVLGLNDESLGRWVGVAIVVLLARAILAALDPGATRRTALRSLGLATVVLLVLAALLYLRFFHLSSDSMHLVVWLTGTGLALAAIGTWLGSREVRGWATPLLLLGVAALAAAARLYVVGYLSPGRAGSHLRVARTVLLASGPALYATAAALAALRRWRLVRSLSWLAAVGLWLGALTFLMAAEMDASFPSVRAAIPTWILVFGFPLVASSAAIAAALDEWPPGKAEAATTLRRSLFALVLALPISFVVCSCAAMVAGTF